MVKNIDNINTEQAIILCAGRGSRLKELTEDIPKCLIKVNNKPLLAYHLEKLQNCGIKKVILVTGYKDDKIKEFLNIYSYPLLEIILVHNAKWNKTNNIYSLYCAKEYFKVDSLLIECDLIYEEDTLKQLIESQKTDLVVVDRFNEQTMNGTTVNITGCFINHFYMNTEGVRDVWKTVNIYKLSAYCLEKRILPLLEEKINENLVNIYYEVTFKELTDKGYPFEAFIISEDKWQEIDTEDDLKLGEEKFLTIEKLYKKVKKSHGGYHTFSQKFLDFSYLYNSYFPDRSLYEQLLKTVKDQIKNYPSSQKIICEKLNKWLNINADYLAVGNGGAEFINLLKNEYFQFIIFNKGFKEYERNLTRYQKIYIDEQAILESIKNEEINKENNALVIINPNNPTGYGFNKKEIKEICQKFKGDVILDESFIDFSDEDSMLDEIENFDNLIILKSMSKNFGIAGLRLGWIAKNDKKWVQEIRNKLPIWNINGIAERFLEILPYFRFQYKESIEKIKDDREYVFNELNNLPSTITPYPYLNANYIFCQLHNGLNSTELEKELFVQHNILIKDCSNRIGCKNENFVRIAVKPKEETNILINALKDILKNG